MSSLTTVTTPLVVLVCAAWVGLLAWSNVRERRSEIGLLRALGKGSGKIASLFFGRAALLGLIGGCVGCDNDADCLSGSCQLGPVCNSGPNVGQDCRPNPLS